VLIVAKADDASAAACEHAGRSGSAGNGRETLATGDDHVRAGTVDNAALEGESAPALPRAHSGAGPALPEVAVLHAPADADAAVDSGRRAAAPAEASMVGGDLSLATGQGASVAAGVLGGAETKGGDSAEVRPAVLEDTSEPAALVHGADAAGEIGTKLIADAETTSVRDVREASREVEQDAQLEIGAEDGAEPAAEIIMQDGGDDSTSHELERGTADSTRASDAAQVANHAAKTGGDCSEHDAADQPPAPAYPALACLRGGEAAELCGQEADHQDAGAAASSAMHAEVAQEACAEEVATEAASVVTSAQAAAEAVMEDADEQESVSDVTAEPVGEGSEHGEVPMEEARVEASADGHHVEQGDGRSHGEAGGEPRECVLPVPITCAQGDSAKPNKPEESLGIDVNAALETCLQNALVSPGKSEALIEAATPVASTGANADATVMASAPSPEDGTPLASTTRDEGAPSRHLEDPGTPEFTGANSADVRLPSPRCAEHADSCLAAPSDAIQSPQSSAAAPLEQVVPAAVPCADSATRDEALECGTERPLPCKARGGC